MASFSRRYGRSAAAVHPSRWLYNRKRVFRSPTGRGKARFAPRTRFWGEAMPLHVEVGQPAKGREFTDARFYVK